MGVRLTCRAILRCALAAVDCESRATNGPDVGGIWTHWAEILRFLHECVGFRVGLSVGEDRLIADLTVVGAPLASAAASEVRRYRSRDVEHSARLLLQHYGDPAATNLYPVLGYLRSLADDGSSLSILEDLLDARGVDLLGSGFASGTPWEQLQREAEIRFGASGVRVLDGLRNAAALDAHLSPWRSQRRVEWRDVLDLADLSESKGVAAMHGTCFDQRFINFLARDVDRIDIMNWRKFEALIAERFLRIGFRVELGPGRGDGGVDIRVWAQDDESALTIIQCKRQRSSVPQVVVKALASDVAWIGADHGLLVTTSRVSPSAERVIEARSYPVEVVERDAIWVFPTVVGEPVAGAW
jgi:restriction system protein